MTSQDYQRVKDLLTKEQFESKVRQKMDEWADLLDERTAAMLVLDEHGRLEVRFNAIKELQDAQEVSLRAKVVSISPVRTFTRRTGESGRVVNVELDDGSGKCFLALWDDDVKLVETGYVKVGKVLRALDCYARRSNFGPEVSRGKFGTIVMEG